MTIQNPPGPPNDDVDLTVGGLGEMQNLAARRLYDSYVLQYAEKLLDEASKYEEEHRGSSSTDRQYTTAHIAAAYTVVKNRGIAPKKRPKGITITRIGSAAGWGLFGLFGGFWSNDPGWGTLAATTGVIALLTTIAAEVWDHYWSKE